MAASRDLPARRRSSAFHGRHWSRRSSGLASISTARNVRPSNNGSSLRRQVPQELQPMNETGLYLDDLYVGRRFATGTYRVEETDILRFAAEFDPQPFHLDQSAAESSVFK